MTMRKNLSFTKDWIYAFLSFKGHFVDQRVHPRNSTIVCRKTKTTLHTAPYNISARSYHAWYQASVPAGWPQNYSTTISTTNTYENRNVIRYNLTTPRPHVSGYFWIRNVFFPDSKFLRPHVAYSNRIRLSTRMCAADVIRIHSWELGLHVVPPYWFLAQ